MSENSARTQDADPAEEDYTSGLMETPIAVRAARVLGGALLGLVSVGLIVFLSITAQDRSAQSQEEAFLAAQEAAANVLPLDERLQEKYGVSDEDLNTALGDLKRFDNTITNNLDVNQLTEIQVQDNRFVFLTGASRYFFESSSPTAFDYLKNYVDNELIPNIDAED